ncbi:hypothetical protein P691DRAFT_807224 [Macrolepiota fuliginosa MF-IS2]|uniref:Uncharacterized protein n=1 Tax=Macrolepiota fuliginosa MF-IS2 TaxID=1400762 RepID=A0A9P6C4S6_9AGAR|nr:hypothetical protein P691DRAFT_807224 [Macrolepiota fuliginosa MF-IS2]
MSNKPVLIVTSEEDTMMPQEWAKWLAEKYPDARLNEVIGGHIAGLWSIDSTWEDLLSIRG